MRCRKEIHSDYFYMLVEKQVEHLPLLDDWYLKEYQGKVAALIQEILNKY